MPSFKIGTNLKINLNGERAKLKDKPDVKSNEDRKQNVKPSIKSNKEHKPITDSNREHKSTIEFNKEHKQDVKKPDTNKITYEEEKVALVLGITTIFTVWWMFK